MIFEIIKLIFCLFVIIAKIGMFAMTMFFIYRSIKIKGEDKIMYILGALFSSIFWHYRWCVICKELKL